MTRRNLLEKCLGWHSNPSRNEVESAVDRVWQNLQTAAPAAAARNDARQPAGPQRWALAAVAAAAVFAVVSGAVIRNSFLQSNAPAVIEDIHGSRPIEFGQIIRSNGGQGDVLTLKDGSRVEMRSKSELALEAAADGVIVRLNSGSVIVTAAKQRGGHLYVRTKDLSIAVVGTVFLVDAGETGSRVAVIEGEVRVQQGTVEKKLRMGEQVATSVPLAVNPVKEVMSWSRNVEQHLAMLREAVKIETVEIVPATNATQNPSERFEEASIRLSPPPPQGTRGGGGGGNVLRNENPCFLRQRLQLNPGRFISNRTTLHGLITAAYGVRCLAPYSVSGEPEWSRTERYEIEAIIPPGSPVYTVETLLEGNAPNLQRMLQNLLADRFKLRVRREMKEMAAYNLVVVKPGTWNCRPPESCHGLKLAEDQTPDGVSKDTVGFTPIPTTLNLHTTISYWTAVATLNTGAPVIDKTGLKGYYDIRLEFRYPESVVQNPSGRQVMEDYRKEQFPVVIQDQLGFKLEPTRALVEVLVIEHVEKPSN